MEDRSGLELEAWDPAGTPWSFKLKCSPAPETLQDVVQPNTMHRKLARYAGCW